MKATSLSISVSNKCNKNCPYCVSKMTNGIKENNPLFYKNLDKVYKFAEMANVTSVIITGKGEPYLEENEFILNTISKKFKDFPLEIQTNGINIMRNPKLVGKYDNIDTIAISIDHPSYLLGPFMDGVKEAAKLYDKNIRYTINLSRVFENYTFIDILEMIKKQGVADQASFRHIVSPSFIHSGGEGIKQWIEENKCDEVYEKKIKEFLDYPNKRVMRALPYGATLYDVEGIGFTYFEFCIQEENRDDDIRSLVYQLDGHLYTSWESIPAARIF